MVNHEYIIKNYYKLSIVDCPWMDPYYFLPKLKHCSTLLIFLLWLFYGGPFRFSLCLQTLAMNDYHHNEAARPEYISLHPISHVYVLMRHIQYFLIKSGVRHRSITEFQPLLSFNLPFSIHLTWLFSTHLSSSTRTSPSAAAWGSSLAKTRGCTHLWSLAARKA